MSIRVISGTVTKSNSNPESVGTWKDGKKVVPKKKKPSSSSSSSKTSSRSKPVDVNTGMSMAFNPFTNPEPNMSTPSGPVYAPPPKYTPPAPSPSPVKDSFKPGVPDKNVIYDVLNSGFMAPNPDVVPVSEDGSFSNRMQNVNEVLKAAISGRGGIQANVGNDFAGGLLETAANNPFETALTVTGVSGLVKGVGRALTKTAVSEASTIGKIGTSAATNTAETVATNTVTKAKTIKWLENLMSSTKTVTSVNPETGKTVTQIVTSTGKLIDAKTVVNGLMVSIGSYPFAGFIKEEALQTVGFAVKTAIDNGDLVGAQDAIDMQNEILDPSLWDNIIGAIPFVNVIAKLKDFYDAARLKNNIDQKVVNDMKSQVDNGLSDDDFYANIDSERAARKEAERASDEAYWANVQRLRDEAKAADRKENEEYWAKIYAEKDALAARKRQEEEDYWTAYFKRLNDLKYSQNKTSSSKSSYEPPSNLNFGLL